MKEIAQEINLIELTIDGISWFKGEKLYFLGDKEAQAFLDKHRISSNYATQYAPATKQCGKMYLCGQTEPLGEIEGGWTISGHEDLINAIVTK